MRISDWSSDVCSADLAAIERGGADLRRAAGGGLDQDVTALGGEAGGVDEAGELDLAQFCRPGLAGERGGDGAVGANGDRQSVVEGRRVSVGVDVGGGRIVTKKTI